MSDEITELPPSYYDFRRYVDRQRWLTYYRQLTIVLPTAPARVLEIGVGPGIVRAVLRDRGVRVETVDINDSLGADYVADVRSLPPAVTDPKWDWVICSRVLHHVPVAEIPATLSALSALHADRVLVTVPREDLSLQFTWRRTAGRARNFRVSLGVWLKRILRRTSAIKSDPSGVWMLDDGRDGFSRATFRSALTAEFTVDDEFVLPDDPSHVFFVLSAR